MKYHDLAFEINSELFGGDEFVDDEDVEQVRKIIEQRLEAGQVDAIVILRETLEKELERFTEIQKTAKTRGDINYYKGIRNGISNAINYIIQIKHLAK